MPPKPDPSKKDGEPEAQVEDTKKEEVKDETTKEAAKEEAEKEAKEEVKEETKETAEKETEETKKEETKDEETKTEETKKEEDKEDKMEIDEPADEKEETKEEKKADKTEETTEAKKEEKEVEKPENDTEKQDEKMEEEPEKKPKKRGRPSKGSEGKKAEKTKGAKAGGDDKEENDEGEAEKTKEAEEGEREGKRRRRSSKSYVPEDFTNKKDESQPLPNGRGKKLRDIPAVKACIEKYAAGSEDVQAAYRFLVAGRGKVPKNKAKNILLDFNGYLTEMVEGEDPKERENMDEDLESKFSKKAYKLHVPQIRQLLDFFCVDRTPGAEEKADKDFLVERLLDFLSSPSASQVRSTKTPKKERSRSKSVSRGDEEKLPSDEDLRKWVEAYTVCHNMKKATMKQAIEIASEKFGVDVTPKKKLMKAYLAESM